MQLYNENSLIKLKEIPDKTIDCCITDPPYFIDKMASDWDLEKLKASTQKAGVIGGLPVGMKFDPQQGKDLEEFMFKISKELYRILKPGAFFLSFQCRGYIIEWLVVLKMLVLKSVMNIFGNEPVNQKLFHKRTS